MRKTVIAVLLLFLQLVGCSTGPVHPSLQKTALPELIPVRDFTANLDANFNYKLSPDGETLAWIAVQGVKLRIHFRPVDGDKVQVIHDPSRRPIHGYYWGQDSKTLFFQRDNDGDENYHIYRANIDRPQRKPENLTPLGTVRATIENVPRYDPEHILITHNQRDPAVFDLYKLNLNTKQITLLAENPGTVLNWQTDDHGKLHARTRRLKNFAKVLETFHAAGSTNDKKWREIATWVFDDQLRLMGFSADKKSLWALSNKNRDLTALVKIDLQTGREILVHSDKKVDLEGAYISPNTHTPIYVFSAPGYPENHFFAPKDSQQFEQLQQELNGHISFNSTDRTEQKVLLSAYSDKHKSDYLYDRTTGEYQLLGQNTLNKHSAKLASTKPIRFTSRDGLPMHGYLTLPTGTPAKNLPMVLKVHGGPWGRDYWGLNFNNQFLANRGYAVLQVNYRGSTGYGKKHMQAAIGEFAGKMHDDLIDGVQWAIKQGVADKQKICIMGGSYGGYATLVGMTFTPDVFACGVDIVGPSNLVTLTENVPKYWKTFMPFWHKYVGHPDNPAQRKDMEARSPLFKVDAVKKPLLIVQGANDPRVTQLESDQIVKALRDAGKEVEYILFQNEGHGIQRWQNDLTYHRRIEEFLAKHLGGRSAGFDYYELGKYLFPQ